MASRAIIVVTFLWGDKYTTDDVAKLYRGVKRNLLEDFRFICFTDHPRLLLDGIEQYLIPNMELTRVRGCFVRLRLFDPKWQAGLDIEEGTRILNLDLDLVVTGSLDDLVDRQDRFTILQGVNSANPCPYNGSVWMLRAGSCQHVWESFSLEKASKIPFYEFPDDQGWFWELIADASAWGAKDGVFAFKKVGWPKGDDLPAGAKIVAFPGWRDPSKFTHLPWIKEHWV